MTSLQKLKYMAVCAAISVAFFAITPARAQEESSAPMGLLPAESAFSVDAEFSADEETHPRRMRSVLTVFLLSVMLFGIVSLMVATVRELADANIVKVVLDRGGYALYFSRAPIPWPRAAMNEQLALLAILQCSDVVEQVLMIEPRC